MVIGVIISGPPDCWIRRFWPLVEASLLTSLFSYFNSLFFVVFALTAFGKVEGMAETLLTRRQFLMTSLLVFLVGSLVGDYTLMPIR